MIVAASGCIRDNVNRRCARVIPLQNNNALSRFGMVAGGFLSRTARRTYQASGPANVSTIAFPCRGRQDAARIISRTREDPSLATIPGTVSPASE